MRCNLVADVIMHAGRSILGKDSVCIHAGSIHDYISVSQQPSRVPICARTEVPSDLCLILPRNRMMVENILPIDMSLIFSTA